MHFFAQDNERPWRTERFYGVPLCASDCEAWFEACLYDFTCTDNWSLNFRWVTITDDGITKLSDGRQCKNGASSCKVNVCPEGSSCVTFLQMYGNASNFCETVCAFMCSSSVRWYVPSYAPFLDIEMQYPII
ncbi:hypothetical protein HAZT_HAZT001150 [Hyalella azteca]|uniref:Folate receptor-like domain-containing protein n=1 Tax=Hyalella azteca TaxID=294128 RepID=A0A6A0HB29_HYAAZ|nr:hypothetical protein HAZT_HAZT001150 [Hyalella azteca]